MSARFRPGDRVRTRVTNPETHTRLPHYLCDRAGTIEAVHGSFALADERALGAPLDRCTRETLYTVSFEGREVWRGRQVEPLSVCADLWDSYLEPERAR